MNLLGPELVRDLVSFIERAEPTTRSKCSCSPARIPTTSSRNVDLTRVEEYRAEATRLVGEPSIALLLHRLSTSRLAHTSTEDVGIAPEILDRSEGDRIHTLLDGVSRTPVRTDQRLPTRARQRCRPGSEAPSSMVSRPETRS